MKKFDFMFIFFMVLLIVLLFYQGCTGKFTADKNSRPLTPPESLYAPKKGGQV